MPKIAAKVTTGILLVGGFVLAGPALPTSANTVDSPDCSEAKCVALTFDDGPGEHTDRLLDSLAEHDAEATFYLIGSKVDDSKEEVKRMVADGHEVGNHTWQHDDLTTLSADEIRDDLSRTDEAISNVTGENPVTMRPPYGALNDTAREAIDRPILLWDVDTLDWEHRDGDKILDITMNETSDGSVVLFHDIHESTVDAIPAVLDELAADGYEFVTVDDLFGGELAPGTTYSDARPEETQPAR